MTKALFILICIHTEMKMILRVFFLKIIYLKFRRGKKVNFVKFNMQNGSLTCSKNSRLKY